MGPQEAPFFREEEAVYGDVTIILSAEESIMSGARTGAARAPRRPAGAAIGIKAKMLAGILPFVLLSLVIMAVVMVVNSRSIIHEQTQAQMEALLDANINDTDAKLDSVRTTAKALARNVGASYHSTDIKTYAKTFEDTISDNELISGAGIWFEPKVYDPKQEYYGPYWYKTEGGYEEDWEYSNAEYDYFNQEYYTNAKGMKAGEATITDPYYDEASQVVMASCSAPIYDGDTYIGCITCDLTLESIEESMAGIKIGKTGIIILTSSDGTYIYNPNDPSAAANGLKITADSGGIATVGSQIMSSQEGTAAFNGGGKACNVYYSTVPEVNWKLALVMPLDEINAPVKQMTAMSFVICVIAVIVCVVVIFIQANGIAKAMTEVKKFAQDLASGNFTVDKIKVTRRDEIGQMSDSLNEMYENNSDVIRNISIGSGKVNTSSNQLDEVAVNLSTQFGNIQDSMVRVNDAMTNTGAATEQVSASANEVNASVSRLAEETEKTAAEVEKIQERAAEIVKNSKASSANAIAIAEKRGKELKEASERAKVVEEIGTLADSIEDIASQINLLSLNASIEAARAGEHGRGFAVVASEINNLAMETKEAVEKIQSTIHAVQEAFTSLDESSGQLLAFVQETVTPDYDNFVVIGQQYGEDAESFGKMSEQVAEMVDYIKESMEQVNAAVASIAESATETASSSSEVTDTVNEVSDMVDDVSGMAQEQKSVSDDLSSIVSQFTLTDV